MQFTISGTHQQNFSSFEGHCSRLAFYETPASHESHEDISKEVYLRAKLAIGAETVHQLEEIKQRQQDQGGEQSSEEKENISSQFSVDICSVDELPGEYRQMLYEYEDSIRDAGIFFLLQKPFQNTTVHILKESDDAVIGGFITIGTLQRPHRKSASIDEMVAGYLALFSRLGKYLPEVKYAENRKEPHRKEMFD